MLFVIIGVGILIGHFMGVGPMAKWDWELTGDLWKFAAPFLLAAVWWAWADASGLTKRREIEREKQRVVERKRKLNEALGRTASMQDASASRKSSRK